MFSRKNIINDINCANCASYANSFYEYIEVAFQYISTCFYIIFNITRVYFLWIFLHYFASQLYIKWCVPSTIIGFLWSPFMTATPHCQGLRWILYNGANMINHMWMVLGGWICASWLIVEKERNHTDS